MTARFLVGDVFEQLKTLDDDSVDLVLTSPPFLALRSYLPADHPDKHLEGGSQATPGEYIDWLVDVVEALDRVIAPHGTLCIELGDTYSGSGGAGGDYQEAGLRAGQPVVDGSARRNAGGDRKNTGNTSRGTPRGNGWPSLSKSLTLIPELFRMTLVYGTNPLTGRQTEPWRLRNVIRWVRPNPPVGALGDKFRPATSELMVLCKSAKRYVDLDAVREPGPIPLPSKRGATEFERDPAKARKDTIGMDRHPAGAPPLDWWNIPTHPYKGAHYATWPPALCVKPIKAMSPLRVCVVCGEPSRRIVEKTDEYAAHRLRSSEAGTDYRERRNVEGWRAEGRPSNERQDASYNTIGWSDCGHNNWRPGHVLDIFAGTGVVGAVATGLGRNATLIDLDERNLELARDRVGPLLFDDGGLQVSSARTQGDAP